jgi:hypothetical protein
MLSQDFLFGSGPIFEPKCLAFGWVRTDVQDVARFYRSLMAEHGFSYS